MNTQNWIKRSEREPKRDEYPIFTGRYDVRDGQWAETTWYAEIGNGWEYTHWRSVKAEPPPRELTQRERDEAMVLQLRQRLGTTANQDCLDAIYAERREVLKLVSALFPYAPNWGNENHFNDEWKALRARLDEQGAK